MINYTLFLAVYFMLDALHDKFVIEGRGAVTVKWKEKAWHIVDAIIKCFVGVVVYHYMIGVTTYIELGLVIGFIGFFRAWWFNSWINIFRGIKNIFHLGNTPPEGWFKKCEWLYFLICFSLSILLYLILN